MNFLQGYPTSLQNQAQSLLDQGKLGVMLQSKYPQMHTIRTDKALFEYLLELKSQYLRNAEPLNKAVFDSKLQVVAHALGTHTTVSRVQGSKLKAKREIRIASLFRETPLAFLKMIAVHELAHIREKAHDRAFYQLCTYMEPQYHQLEFDLRLYLTHLHQLGPLQWGEVTPR